MNSKRPLYVRDGTKESIAVVAAGMQQLLGMETAAGAAAGSTVIDGRNLHRHRFSVELKVGFVRLQSCNTVAMVYMNAKAV